MSAASSLFAHRDTRPPAAAAVIADARRRARRRRIATTTVLLAAVAAYLLTGHPGLGVSGQTARHAPSARAAGACLVAQHALVATAQTGPQFLSAPAVHVSFALVANHRHDGMTIFFQRSPADATGVVRRLLTTMRPNERIARSYLTVAHSSVVLWDSPGISAPVRAAVLGCL